MQALSAYASAEVGVQLDLSVRAVYFLTSGLASGESDLTGLLGEGGWRYGLRFSEAAW